jgi:hypothetical protein
MKDATICRRIKWERKIVPFSNWELDTVPARAGSIEAYGSCLDSATLTCLVA